MQQGSGPPGGVSVEGSMGGLGNQIVRCSPCWGQGVVPSK